MSSSEATLSPVQSGKDNIYTAIFTMVLVFMPVVAFFFPRLMAYAPGAVAIIAALVGFFLLARKPVRPGAALLWVIVITGLAGLSSFWSLAPDFAVQRTLKMALVLFPGILLLGLVLSADNERVRRYLWLLPVCVGLAACFNIIELSFGMSFHRFLRGLSMGDNVSPAVANRSIFCTVAAFFVCIPIILNQDIQKRFRYIALAVLGALIVLMLMLSESQSSQLCFVVGLFFFFVFPYRLKAAWIFIAVVSVLLILAAPFIVQIMFKTLPEHIGTIQSGSWLANGYATNRMEIWDFISRYIMQSPLYGYGVEATRHIQDFDSQMLYHPDSAVLHPHNFALQLWIEFGVIGAASGCLFLTHLLYRIYQMPVEAARIALPTLFCFFSVASTGYGMWQGWWLGECMLMLSLSTLVIRAYYKP